MKYRVKLDIEQPISDWPPPIGARVAVIWNYGDAAGETTATVVSVEPYDDQPPVGTYR